MTGSLMPWSMSCWETIVSGTYVDVNLTHLFLHWCRPTTSPHGNIYTEHPQYVLDKLVWQHTGSAANIMLETTTHRQRFSGVHASMALSSFGTYTILSRWFYCNGWSANIWTPDWINPTHKKQVSHMIRVIKKCHRLYDCTLWGVLVYIYLGSVTGHTLCLRIRI